MPRLTVTLDDEAARELSGLKVEEFRDVVRRAMESAPADEAMWVMLSRSLGELGDSPSRSAVVRAAVAVFLGLLEDAKVSVALRAGYQQLSADAEREQVVEAISKRAPTRWGHEA